MSQRASCERGAPRRWRAWRLPLAVLLGGAALTAACRVDGGDERSGGAEDGGAGGGAGAIAPAAAGGSARRETRVDLLADWLRAQSSHRGAGAAPSLIGDWEKNTADADFELSVAAGASLEWRDVELHDGAELHWRAGVSKLDAHGLAGPLVATLELLREGAPPLPLLEVPFAKGEAAPREGVIELREWAGARGTLRLAVSASDGGATRLSWTQLELRSLGRERRAADATLEVDAVAVHLAELLDAETAAADVLTVAVPGRLPLRVRVPERARLRWFDVLPPAGAGAVKLRVRVDGEVVREWKRAATGAERSRELSIDLARFGGREVELAFEAEPVGAAPDAAAPPPAVQFVLPRLIAPRATPRQPRAPGRPDLFLIVIDTLRADALSCYGAARATSPQLDAFAADALLFERAYAPASWTLPSMASLLTGLPPDVHGTTTVPWLSDRHETFAERCAAAGFTTGAFVANSLLSRDSNFQQGFESWQELSWGNAKKVARRVLEWVDRHPDERLFGWVHLVDPHAPYSAPLPDAQRFESAADNPFRELGSDALLARFTGAPLHEQVEQGLTPELAAAAARGRDLYDDEVRWCDAAVGALLDGLRARGRLDEAVVVVTADHGEEFLEHRGIFHGDHLYDESVRVPLIVRAPTLAPGRAAEPFGTVDVAALMAELCEQAERAAQGGAAGRGVERAPLPAERFPESIVLATEHATERDRLPFGRREALVRGRWKLIASPRLETLELYDLLADPHERHDLSESEPRVRDALAQLLRDRCAEHARQAGANPAAVLPDLAAELRRLGYVK